MKNLFLSVVVLAGLGLCSCTHPSKDAASQDSGETLNQEISTEMAGDSSLDKKSLMSHLPGYDTAGQLEIFEITNEKIEFVDSVMPLDAFICVPAAFTKEYFDRFTPEMVANKYITNGVKKQGYDCEISQSGCLAVDENGEWYIGKPNEEKYKNATNYFEQNLIIDNYQVNPKKAITYDASLHFRCLAEVNDKLALIQTIIPTSYPTFIEWLQQIGVKNALYLDMGGWSFGYFRDGDTYYDINPVGSKEELHHNKIENIKRDPNQTNWIVVRNRK